MVSIEEFCSNENRFWEKRMAKQLELSDQDVYAAMKEIEGYLDISIQDFRELYAHAVRHARRRLLASTVVREIMTAEVLSVSAKTPFEGVISAMASRFISGLPVVDASGQVVGVVSEKDIFARLDGEGRASFWKILGRCLSCNQCLLRSLRSLTAADIMSAPPVTVRDTDSARDALRLMRQRRINRLPVVDAKGLLAGIVTRTDILDAGFQLTEG